MKSYVYHMYGALDRCSDGTVMKGTSMVSAWYVYFTIGEETVDIAGPFEDEYDAEMCARRAEEIAA